MNKLTDMQMRIGFSNQLASAPEIPIGFEVWDFNTYKGKLIPKNAMSYDYVTNSWTTLTPAFYSCKDLIIVPKRFVPYYEI